MFTKADSAQPYIYRLFAANGNCCWGFNSFVGAFMFHAVDHITLEAVDFYLLFECRSQVKKHHENKKEDSSTLREIVGEFHFDTTFRLSSFCLKWPAVFSAASFAYHPVSIFAFISYASASVSDMSAIPIASSMS